MSYLGIELAEDRLRAHIAALNAGDYAHEPICDCLKTWADLGVYTPDELDAWIEPMPRKSA